VAETLTTLMTPLDVPISGKQVASLLREEPVPLTRLLIVREIEENESGANLHFDSGGHGRLEGGDAKYADHLRLARRSRERQHPVGVRFGEGHAIKEVVRADNDVPTQLWELGPDRTGVLFQGHDGVFGLTPDHPGISRLRGALAEAIRREAPVWFVAQKPGLGLIDVLPAGWATGDSHPRAEVPIEFKISFVVAPVHILKEAEQILRSSIRATNALRRDIRALAKAYIDEADELKRAVREIQTNASRVQVESLSPQEMIAKARSLRSVQIANKGVQEKVRRLADSYVSIAEKNQQLFDEFKEKYRDKLPPAI
jgi:hypothetical protein